MKNNLLKSTMFYGAFTGLAIILVELTLYLTNLIFLDWTNLISYLIILVGMYIGTANYRENNLEGLLKFKQGIGYGVLMAFFASIIVSFYLYIFYTFIDPEYISKMLEKIHQQMIEQKMPEIKIEENLNIYRKNFTPQGFVNMNIQGITLVGFFLSFLTSALLKKEKTEHII